jgi:thiol-disulfide isomerase/thioredoxin
MQPDDPPSMRGLIVALVVLVLLGGCRGGGGLAAGERFPPIEVVTAEGRSALPPTLQGRATLVAVWASWCAPCREELPALARFADEAGPARLGVVAISVDDDARLLEEFLRRHSPGASVRVVRAAEPRLLPGAARYDRIPVTWLLDADGRVLQRFDTPEWWRQPAARERIRTAIAQGPVAARLPAQ